MTRVAEVPSASKPASLESTPERRATEVRRVTLSGLVLNLTLAAFKFTVGILGASQALVGQIVRKTELALSAPPSGNLNIRAEC